MYTQSYLGIQGEGKDGTPLVALNTSFVWYIIQAPGQDNGTFQYVILICRIPDIPISFQNIFAKPEQCEHSGCRSFFTWQYSTRNPNSTLVELERSQPNVDVQ